MVQGVSTQFQPVAEFTDTGFIKITLKLGSIPIDGTKFAYHIHACDFVEKVLLKLEDPLLEIHEK